MTLVYKFQIDRITDLYWHFRANRENYRIALVGLIIFSQAMILIFWIRERKKLHLEAVKDWPRIEARILESDISLKDNSGSSSLSKVYTVLLKVQYQDPQTGVSHKAEAFNHWGFSQKIGGIAQFEVGKQILIRVNPQDPEHASLYDITGFF